MGGFQMPFAARAGLFGMVALILCGVGTRDAECGAAWHSRPTWSRAERKHVNTTGLLCSRAPLCARFRDSTSSISNVNSGISGAELSGVDRSNRCSFSTCDAEVTIGGRSSRCQTLRILLQTA